MNPSRPTMNGYTTRGDAREEPWRPGRDGEMQSTPDSGPARRHQRRRDEDEHETDVLRQHQPQIRPERRVVPAFVEVLDDAPEGPDTGGEGGKPHRSSAQELSVPLGHRSNPEPENRDFGRTCS